MQSSSVAAGGQQPHLSCGRTSVSYSVTSNRTPGMIAVCAIGRVGRMTCRSAWNLSHGVIRRL